MRSPETRVANPLIAELADDLVPVRPMTVRTGLGWLAAAGLVTIVAVELFEGLWRGMWQGQALPLFWVTNGLLLVLGLAAATTVVAMAAPRVGNQHEAPRWALAAVAVLPLAALAAALAQGQLAAPFLDKHGPFCALGGTAGGLLTGAVLTLWLRRGAPVSLTTAGFYTGVASGALGSVACGLSCPLMGMMHLGIWHVLPVPVAALIGRFAVPALIRW